MSIVLKIVLFLLLLPLGAGIIYRSVDRIHANAVEYRSATGRDVCLLVATVLVLVYCGILVWYFFVG
jgi:TRAP-type C4-dicarboxylate transport system permease small subunit